MRRTRGNGRTTEEAKAAGFVSEREFQKTVVEYAQATGWLCYHQVDMGFKDPETGRQSYSRRIGPGFPDLVLSGHGRVLFIELKSEKGRMRPEQQVWADSLNECPGIENYLLRPSDWDEIEEILSSE